MPVTWHVEFVKVNLLYEQHHKLPYVVSGLPVASLNSFIIYTYLYFHALVVVCVQVFA